MDEYSYRYLYWVPTLQHLYWPKGRGDRSLLPPMVPLPVNLPYLATTPPFSLLLFLFFPILTISYGIVREAKGGSFRGSLFPLAINLLWGLVRSPVSPFIRCVYDLGAYPAFDSLVFSRVVLILLLSAAR
jgi:hypothetical protein